MLIYHHVSHFFCILAPVQNLLFLNQNNSIKKCAVRKRLHWYLGTGLSARIFVDIIKAEKNPSIVPSCCASQQPGWPTIRAAYQVSERATVLQLPA